ncbi:MAG: hypothetical protein WBA58_09760, partial [Giesbergeria sp.]
YCHGVPDRWQAHPLARQSFAKSKGLTMIPVGYVGFHPKRKRAQKVVVAHAGPAEPAIKNAAHLVQQTPSLPPDDACATLRERWQPAPAR